MAQRHEDLLGAAAHLFQTQGIQATAIEDITRASGVSKGAFYKHFDSKDSLILALLERFRDEMLQKAERPSSGSPESPLSTLKRMITVELEVATDYQNFLHAVAMDFPPHSAGAIPDALDGLQKEMRAWHEHILLEAFGARPRRYADDLVVVLEGTLHHYLMTIIWQECALPLDRVGDFIAECLRAIVAGDQDLTPVLSPHAPPAPGSPSALEQMTRELTATRDTIRSAPHRASSADNDVQTLDLLIEELQERPPREFLVDALLAQLHDRQYLTTHLTSTLTSWDVWKGNTS